jgi:hypothetical protein
LPSNLATNGHRFRRVEVLTAMPRRRWSVAEKAAIVAKSLAPGAVTSAIALRRCSPSARTSKDTCAVPCWEQVNFASPVSLAANTTYIAAYHTSNGRYAGDNLRSDERQDERPIDRNSEFGGGRQWRFYTYSIGFPNQTWYASNYYVDVSFTPAAPTPYLTLSLNPPNPSISASAPASTVVTTITVAWSNGNPFTGLLGFASPYSNDRGTFAISGNNLIIDPAGPGVPADSSTIQNVTITAIQ